MPKPAARQSWSMDVASHICEMIRRASVCVTGKAKIQRDSQASVHHLAHCNVCTVCITIHALPDIGVQVARWVVAECMGILKKRQDFRHLKQHQLRSRHAQDRQNSSRHRNLEDSSQACTAQNFTVALRQMCLAASRAARKPEITAPQQPISGTQLDHCRSITALCMTAALHC